MKRLMFSLLVLLMASFVGVNAQVINNEVQFKGSATNVYMGGKHVRDMNDLTFTVAPTEDGRCCLSGHAAFLAAGITYHDMDFTLKKVVFDVLQPNGAISNASGYAHIYIQLFKKFTVLSKDFNVTSLTGNVTDNNLTFHIEAIIPDYKDGYVISFDFTGNKI